MNKLKLGKIMNIVMLILLASLMFYISYVLFKSNNEVYKFCKDKYHNETFMESFSNKEPIELKVCNFTQYVSFNDCGDYTNFNCNEEDYYKYNQCLYNNATNEQIKFMNYCGEDSSAWIMNFAMVAILFFGIFCLLMIFTIILDKENKK